MTKSQNPSTEVRISFFEQHDGDGDDEYLMLHDRVIIQRHPQHLTLGSFLRNQNVESRALDYPAIHRSIQIYKTLSKS